MLVLPAKASLLVHELIGEIAGEEGAVAAIHDARRRFLEPGARPPLSIPSRSRTLIAPCEHPDGEYCARLPAGLLASAPGQAQALRLPGLPRSCLLAPALVCETLDFTAAAPLEKQQVTLLFEAARAGFMCGLALHVDLTMLLEPSGGDVPSCGGDAMSEATAAAAAAAGGGDERVDVSSAWEGSHWRNVLLMLDQGVSLAKGQRVRVRVTCDLGGPLPRYTFRVECEEAQGEADGAAHWRSFGSPLVLPEAALNCNDMMDLMMDG